MDLADREQCQRLIERLLAVVSEPVLVDGVSLEVSASIGVTLVRADIDRSLEVLLRQVDAAMYRAKLAGKNRYYWVDETQIG